LKRGLYYEIASKKETLSYMSINLKDVMRALKGEKFLKYSNI